MGYPVVPKDFTGTVIDNGTLEIIRQLGTGGSGVVYLALDLTSPACDPLYFAVKCMLSSSPELAQQTNTRRRLRHHQEAAIHFLASAHPNVVQVDRVVEEHGHTFIVLEYCEGGDLYEMITRKNCYAGDDDLIKSVFGQIIDAVEYCHSQGIYHRDIKPENILCLEDGKTVLLSDFGLSTREAFTSEYHVGSAYYMSYETLHPEEWPCPAEYEVAPSDIWALGIILTNLICGLSPWHQATHTDQTFAAFDLDSNILLRALPISTETNAILKRIFELDPRRRVGLSELRDAVMNVQNFSSTSMTHPQPRTPVHVVNSDSLALSPSPARSFFSNDSGLIWDTLQSRPTATSSTIAEENLDDNDDDDDEFDLGCPPLSPSSVQSRRNSADSAPSTPSAFTTRFYITPMVPLTESPRKRVPVPRISQLGSTSPDSSDFGEGTNVKSHQRRSSISRVINKMNGWLSRK